MTVAEWLSCADDTERWIPMNEHGTVLYDRETGSQGFASVTPEGAERYRKLFRAMAQRAKARGLVKADAGGGGS